MAPVDEGTILENWVAGGENVEPLARSENIINSDLVSVGGGYYSLFQTGSFFRGADREKFASLLRVTVYGEMPAKKGVRSQKSPEWKKRARGLY